MSEVLGTSGNDLTITIPSAGDTDWATSIRNNCFQLISDHRHEASGDGAKIRGYLGISFTDALVPNNTAILARNSAGTGTIEMYKVSTSDEIVYNGALHRFDADAFAVADNTDSTKDLVLSLGGATTASTMTISSSHTQDRTLSLPDATDTLVGLSTVDVLSNKVFTLPQINDTSADHQYVFAVSELAADRTITLPLLGANDEFTFNAHAAVLSNKTLTLPQINDTSSDHQYVFAVSELAADRTITLPLLGAADEFVFKDHAVTLTNKTLTSPVLNGTLSGTAFLDDDTMAADSAIAAASQQSIKAFVESAYSGTANEITLTAQAIGLADNAIMPGTGSTTLPKGTSAERSGSPQAGMFRYNTDTASFEGYTSSWGSIGGAGGSLDLVFSETFEVTVASSFTTGNNATFDNGGTIDGALADETSAPLSGASSLKYTMGTTSVNDWVKSPAITMETKQKGNEVSISFYYTYDGADGDIEVVGYDNTGSVILNKSTDTLKAATLATLYTAVFTVPSTSASISYGISVTTGNSGKILVMDDVEISTSPFIFAELQAPNDFSAFIANSGTASITTEGPESWLLSATQNGTGIVDILFTVGFFTVIPAVLATALEDNNRNTSIRSLTTAGCTVEVRSVTNSAVDTDFAFAASRQGSDVKALANNIVTPARSNLSDWTSYSPTVVGFGTPSSEDHQWMKFGTNMILSIKFTSGTSTAVEAQVPLPTGYTVDSAFAASVKLVGYGAFSFNNASNQTILATGGDAFVNIGAQATGAAGLTPRNGDAILTTGQVISFFAIVPIQELTLDATFLAALPITKDTREYTDGVTAPSTITGVAQIYVDTADGDLKIKYGDGTVKTIVVDT